MAGWEFSVNVRATLEGMARMRAAYRQGLTNGAHDVALQALNDFLLEPPGVPHKTGRLQGSGTAFIGGTAVEAPPPITSAGLGHGSASLGTPADSPDSDFPWSLGLAIQWGYNTPYAARLHEHPDYHFTEPGTGGKWVEAKLAAHADEYVGQIAKRLAEALKS